MFRVVFYRDYGFTAYDVFVSFNKWAALAVFNRLGNDIDFETGYMLIDENGNKYNAFGYITRA